MFKRHSKKKLPGDHFGVSVRKCGGLFGVGIISGVVKVGFSSAAASNLVLVLPENTCSLTENSLPFGRAYQGALATATATRTPLRDYSSSFNLYIVGEVCGYISLVLASTAIVFVH